MVPQITASISTLDTKHIAGPIREESKMKTSPTEITPIYYKNLPEKYNCDAAVGSKH